MRVRIILGVAVVAACGKPAPTPSPSTPSPTDSPEVYVVPDEPPAEPPPAVAAKGAPPPGRIAVTSKDARTETSLTADAVLAKMTSVYLAGVKRCYRQVLTTDPTARGKLQLAIVVDTTGRSVVTATTFDDRFAACVNDSARTWVFPPPTRDGAPAEASFEIVLQLIPE
ncbi:MAG: AgmX/PglI C-terminal domain-containing protein [Deltaproteobacteria bacterium]|nr:AgmX/PglI C-terminal domain-containing protein [Deltaproteobacteria bacterium]